MRVLIAYASSTGTVEKCVQKLRHHFPTATVCDLTKNKLTPPDPAPYDMVIVGGGIRGGVINAEAQVFLKNLPPKLGSKRLGIFICCSTESRSAEYLAKNVPDALLERARAIMSFGGELDPARARGLNKLLLKLMLSSSKKEGRVPRLFPERIQEFVDRLLA